MTILFKNGCKALSVTCGDSSPKGRAKGLYPVTQYIGMRNGAYLYRYAPLPVFRPPIKRAGDSGCQQHRMTGQPARPERQDRNWKAAHTPQQARLGQS